MNQSEIPIVKRPLLTWVFRGNHSLKLLLVATVGVTVFVRVIPLEMQKRIINKAISLHAFDSLLIYCGIYLAAVVIAGGLKFIISYLQTIIGQQVLADMRNQLYGHVLTLPLDFFRKTQPGMVVQAFVSELATVGEFVGMAVAVPVTSVLSLLAFAVYLVHLNPLLALVSFAIYPVAIFVLPRLQHRANMENKKRVDLSRDFSGKLAEAISGIHEIQSNATFGLEKRKFGSIVSGLQKVRVTWNLYRQGLKVTSNFFTSISPFVIFLIGGYLAINGQLELGALVAFFSAQEKLFDPWSDLIDVYQAYQEASVSYQRTMHYFDESPEFLIEPQNRQPYQLDGHIEVKDLVFTTKEGVQLLDDVTFSLPAGQQLALVGFSGSGKSTLASCIGQLYRYTKGHVLIGGHEVAGLTKRDIASNVGMVSQAPFIFDGTIEENLVYGSAGEVGETAGAEPLKRPDLEDLIELIEQIGLFPDILRFGLNSVLDSSAHSELLPKLIRIRKKMVHRMSVPMSEHVEFFEKETYQQYATVSENIVFGSANRDDFRESNLAANLYFTAFLKEADLLRPLQELGSQICRQAIAIIGNLPPSDLLLEGMPLAAGEVDKYRSLHGRLASLDWSRLDPADHKDLLELGLRFTPGRHRLVSLTEELKGNILTLRSRFRERVSADLPEAFSFYRKSDYLSSQTILNNIFFGRFKTDNPRAHDTIYEQVVRLLIEEEILEAVLKVGMSFQVGSKGDRLSGGQRQKIAIGRAFIKKPKVLIMDEATSALDNRSQTRIQSLLDTHWKGKTTLIAVIHRLDIIKAYDKIGVMKAGKIEEIGAYDELLDKKGLLFELITGKR